MFCVEENIKENITKQTSPIQYIRRGTLIYLLGYKIIFTEVFWYPISPQKKIKNENNWVPKNLCKNNFVTQ